MIFSYVPHENVLSFNTCMFSEHIEDEKQYMINITLYYFDHKRHVSAFLHLK